MNYIIIFAIIGSAALIALFFVISRIKTTERRKRAWLRTLSPSEDCEIHLPTNKSIVGKVKTVREDSVELIVNIDKRWIYPPNE
jgi:hypothetical protein